MQVNDFNIKLKKFYKSWFANDPMLRNARQDMYFLCVCGLVYAASTQEEISSKAVTGDQRKS